MGFMPKASDRLFCDLLDGPVSILIAVRSGEDDDAEFHGFP
jgi:hypothetical protein